MFQTKRKVMDVAKMLLTAFLLTVFLLTAFLLTVFLLIAFLLTAFLLTVFLLTAFLRTVFLLTAFLRQVCAKVFQTKRKVMDVAKMRSEGTDNAKFLQVSSLPRIYVHLSEYTYI